MGERLAYALRIAGAVPEIAREFDARVYAEGIGDLAEYLDDPLYKIPNINLGVVELDRAALCSIVVKDDIEDLGRFRRFGMDDLAVAVHSLDANGLGLPYEPGCAQDRHERRSQLPA